MQCYCTRNMNVVNIERDHGKDPVCFKNVDSGIGHELPATLRD
jgi:hypothetical protein